MKGENLLFFVFLTIQFCKKIGNNLQENRESITFVTCVNN